MIDWRSTLNQLNSQLSNTYDSGVSNALDRLGLEPKRDPNDLILPAIGVFSAGLVVGAALGVLFAPKGGNELRGDLRHRLDDLRHRGQTRYDELRSERLDAGE
jgi:hypothetical protein